MARPAEREVSRQLPLGAASNVVDGDDAVATRLLVGRQPVVCVGENGRDNAAPAAAAQKDHCQCDGQHKGERAGTDADNKQHGDTVLVVLVVGVVLVL